jgi:hypothetical protein
MYSINPLIFKELDFLFLKKNSDYLKVSRVAPPASEGWHLRGGAPQRIRWGGGHPSRLGSTPASTFRLL